MPFATINGTNYKVREGAARLDTLLIEDRDRALTGTLIVSRVADKMTGRLTVDGLAGSNRFFTIAEAKTFRDLLKANANLTISGDLLLGGTGTFRASDVGVVFTSDRQGGTVTTYASVEFAIEEV